MTAIMFVVIDLALLVGVMTSTFSLFVAKRTRHLSPPIQFSMFCLWAALTAFTAGNFLTSPLVIGMLTVEAGALKLIGLNIFGGSFSNSVP